MLTIQKKKKKLLRWCYADNSREVNTSSGKLLLGGHIAKLIIIHLNIANQMHRKGDSIGFVAYGCSVM